MTGVIDFYFDFLSPYGYLAATQIDDLAAKFQRDVTWRPFLVGVPVLRVMGLKPLMDTPLKSDYLIKDIARLAKILDVPLAASRRTPMNSRAAARAYYWVYDQDEALAKTLAGALLDACWVRGEDISSPDRVIVEAQNLGLDGQQLRAALTTPELKQRLVQEVDRALDKGVFGSPFFIVDGEPFWGVDRLWMLELWLEKGKW